MASLYKYLNKCYYYKVDIPHRINRANNRLRRLPQAQLSKEEQKKCNLLWKGWNISSFKFYKAFCGSVDERYVPNDYYDFAEHVLNLRWSAFFLQHKCCLKYIIPKENRPISIFQKIDGHYVTEDNVEMSESEARDILSNTNEFVSKVALGSGGGYGVQKICWDGIANKDLVIDKLFKKNDMIFQKVINQCDFLARFNPDSVNTLRLLTLNINGKCTLLSSFIRMGAKGSFVDNLCTGGGCLVGVTQDGQLSDFGIDKSYQKVYDSPTRMSFNGQQVPNWKTIKEKIVAFHQRIPYANLIGWDVTIGQNGEPIVVEVNLDSAEVEAHQVFNGSVFGDRLEEVRLYIEQRRPFLRHAMITY